MIPLPSWTAPLCGSNAVFRGVFVIVSALPLTKSGAAQLAYAAIRFGGLWMPARQSLQRQAAMHEAVYHISGQLPNIKSILLLCRR